MIKVEAEIMHLLAFRMEKEPSRVAAEQAPAQNPALNSSEESRQAVCWMLPPSEEAEHPDIPGTVGVLSSHSASSLSRGSQASRRPGLCRGH